MIYRLNNVLIDLNKQQVINEITYVARALLNDGPKRFAIGIIDEADPVFPDPKLFTWVWDYSPGGTIIQIARTPEEIAANDLIAADAVEKNIVKNDVAVRYLRDHTIDEINTYITNQINSAAMPAGATKNSVQAIEVLLKKMASINALDAKKTLR